MVLLLCLSWYKFLLAEGARTVEDDIEWVGYCNYLNNSKINEIVSFINYYFIWYIFNLVILVPLIATSIDKNMIVKALWQLDISQVKHTNKSANHNYFVISLFAVMKMRLRNL